jgi:ribosomal protein S27AE
MQCSKCGAEMVMTEKDTSSGRDMREYTCRQCGHSDWEEYGTALWKILSDDRAEAAAAQASLAAVTPLTDAERPQAPSRWSRLTTRIAGILRRTR